MSNSRMVLQRKGGYGWGVRIVHVPTSRIRNSMCLLGWRGESGAYVRVLFPGFDVDVYRQGGAYGRVCGRTARELGSREAFRIVRVR